MSLDQRAMMAPPLAVRARWEAVRMGSSSLLAALLPGLIVVGLMLVWAADDGGYDAGTWYWGALLLLGVLVALLLTLGVRRERVPASLRIAWLAFAAYVAWSYLSIAWSEAPGTALEGSNRALLYLLVFTLMAAIPWRTSVALGLLCLFALGVGAIALLEVLRLASAVNLPGMFGSARLVSPTGYFNSSAALFTMDALVATALATRRELPALVRGLLLGSACASLQLTLLAQSRGWLFTLPVVLLVTVLLVRERLRFVAFAVIPVVATLIPARRLLALFAAYQHPDFATAARSAGREALILTVVAVVAGTLLSWADQLWRRPAMSGKASRLLGTALTVVVVAVGAAGVAAATHGDPVGFAKRQWNGFSHEPRHPAKGTYFATIGSSRYDFWRVAVDAVAAHPVGGLGQDNFADYYVSRRRNGEEPQWVHSFELRLLAHTGVVGFLLFTVFAVAALAAVVRRRRRGPALVGAVAAAGMLPFVVWVVHGSVDWFWEFPALSGPAFGFLGMAAALREDDPPAGPPPPGLRAYRPRLTHLPVALAALAAAVVLLFPYLAARDVSSASELAARNPSAALADLAEASRLNPLSSDPDLRAGLIALRTGQNAVARGRFSQAISRERYQWLGWLGLGLADSALGRRGPAATAYRTAYRINNQQPPIRVGLRRVAGPHPLTYRQAATLLAIAP